MNSLMFCLPRPIDQCEATPFWASENVIAFFLADVKTNTNTELFHVGAPYFIFFSSGVYLALLHFAILLVTIKLHFQIHYGTRQN